MNCRLWYHLDRWYNLSAHAAAKKLILLGYHDALISWEYSEKTPLAIARCDQFKSALARDVGLFRFVGGPPGFCNLYQGTLLMLLVDRMLRTEEKSK